MGPRSGWSQRARHPVRRRPAEVSPRFGDERPHSDENDGMHGTEPCKRRMQPPVGYENDVCRASMAGLAVPDLDRCGDGLDASGYRRRVFLRITVTEWRHVATESARLSRCATARLRTAWLTSSLPWSRTAGDRTASGRPTTSRTSGRPQVLIRRPRAPRLRRPALASSEQWARASAAWAPSQPAFRPPVNDGVDNPAARLPQPGLGRRWLC
jgi:hypothetical protein